MEGGCAAGDAWWCRRLCVQLSPARIREGGCCVYEIRSERSTTTTSQESQSPPPPVRVQSIISSRSASPSRAHLFRASIYHAVSHSLNPSRPPSRACEKSLIRCLSLSLPISHPATQSMPLSSHQFPSSPSDGVPFCLPLIVVPNVGGRARQAPGGGRPDAEVILNPTALPPLHD